MSALIKKSGGAHGYGFVTYEVEGTIDEVDEAIANLNVNYGNADYCLGFSWPPGQIGRDGKPFVRDAPTDLGDGRWIARGTRRASAD